MKSHLLTAILSAVTATGVNQLTSEKFDTIEVNRLVVRDELIVSDTGVPWEAGYEEEMIPRGVVARGGDFPRAGLWVRSRLIQSEIDDPFDVRFHSVNSNGEIHRAPGHISWNCWLDGAWRQMAIVQGEGLEYSEVPREQWSGGNHPGRIRLQTFRPNHKEPLTDAIIGQGKMSLGGGGYGGGGLPYPEKVLQLWGGGFESNSLQTPKPPQVLSTDNSGKHTYQLIALGAQGNRSLPSDPLTAPGKAILQWDSVPGADAYLVVRDNQVVTEPLRIEGSQKQWEDSSEN